MQAQGVVHHPQGLQQVGHVGQVGGVPCWQLHVPALLALPYQLLHVLPVLQQCPRLASDVLESCGAMQGELHVIQVCCQGLERSRGDQLPYAIQQHDDRHRHSGKL